jgi:predicted GNAT superfamily acetyltransferase
MEIRELRGVGEFHAVEEMQKEVWGCSDLEVVPAVHFIPVCAVGGILLGAFDGQTLAGFVYGFPGFEGEERIIHSDMLAVRSTHRDRGLGRALKMAQRERALAMGIHKITWTFDPLQARNAHLNFAQLGVTADRYLRDFYGETTSPLHRMGTDRLWVTWHLDKQGGGPSPAPALRIEIPPDISALPVVEALLWRQKTRRGFEEAFARKLIVTGFDRQGSEYLLA